MDRITRTLSEQVKLGDYLASNKQWSNAIVAFSKAFALMMQSARGGASLGSISGLHDALSGFGTRSVATREAPVALQQLRDAHQKASGLDFGTASLVSALPCPDGKHFVVSYYDEKAYMLGKLNIAIPVGESISFVVAPHDDGVLSARLTPLAARQLSYIVAHLGWAWVTSTIFQYYQRIILPDEGVPAILGRATYYDFALRLHPNNDWALAHLAEVYRDIANGWPGSTDSLSMPDERVDNYVRSLVLFQAAIEINPRAFWAHAHLGAAIVNVRAFVGPLEDAAQVSPPLEDAAQVSPSLEDTAHVPPSLAALLESWFGRSGDDPINNDIAFVDKAISVLITAQKLVANYYPWAEAYYADALLVKALILGHDAPNELGLLGMLETLTGYYLDPNMLYQVFGPGDLVESGFFSPAMVSLVTKQFGAAWQYAYLGMGRLFKDQFIPGIQALYGSQILANIAAGHIEQLESGEAQPVSPRPWFLQSHAPDWIPTGIISTREGLVQFIDESTTMLFRDFIRVWLATETIVNTSLQMSLHQCIYIFVDLRSLLRACGGHGAEGVVEKIDGFIMEVWEKIFPGKKLPSAILNAYTRTTTDMLSMLYAGKPSYHMSATTAKLRLG